MGLGAPLDPRWQTLPAHLVGVDEITRILYHLATVVGSTLTSLTLFSHGRAPINNDISEEEEMMAFVGVLERFEVLEELEWWDQRGEQWGDWLTERLTQNGLSGLGKVRTVRINCEADAGERE